MIGVLVICMSAYVNRTNRTKLDFTSSVVVPKRKRDALAKRFNLTLILFTFSVNHPKANDQAAATT